MRTARRGRGTRHDDLRELSSLQRGRRRTESIHLTLRAQPHLFG